MSVVCEQQMSRVSVDEIERALSVYLQRVEAGEQFVIVKAGKPLAEIKPVHWLLASLRPYGLCTGEFTVPDDFDASLPENLVQEFEGR
jgi:antitoxin (DNA-binding transcriptional repressor) of toxin-antitoxin stability system